MTHPPVLWHFWRGPLKDKKGVHSKFLGKSILSRIFLLLIPILKSLTNKNHSCKEGQGCLLPKSILHSACAMDCLTINCFYLARKENIVFNLQLVESTDGKPMDTEGPLYIYWKISACKWTVQFKPMLSKGQLYYFIICVNRNSRTYLRMSFQELP